MAWSPGEAKSPAAAHSGSFALKNKAIIRLIYSEPQFGAAATLQSLSPGASFTESNDWIIYLFLKQTKIHFI